MAELGALEDHGVTRAGRRRIIPVEPAPHAAFERPVHLASCTREGNRVRSAAYRVS